jgi:hypothetical protein
MDTSVSEGCATSIFRAKVSGIRIQPKYGDVTTRRPHVFVISLSLLPPSKFFSDFHFLIDKMDFVYFRWNKKLQAIHELLCWRLQNQELTGRCLDLKHVLNRNNIERILSPDRSVVVNFWNIHNDKL